MTISVTLKEYHVDLQRHLISLEYEKEINNLEEFKESFLKRLGNIHADNKTSGRELATIKPIVWEEDSINGIVTRINKLRRWRIEVEVH